MRNTKNVLVVDDDENILFAFRQVLKKDGYRCVVAKSGTKALSVMDAQPPDIVFMDIAMPGLNGLDTLQHMKRRRPDVPVIMITGHGSMQTAIKAIQLGAFEYLTKPLDVEKIRDVLRRVLSSEETEALPDSPHLTFRADHSDRYDLIGNSPAMQEVYKLIGSVSTTTNHTSVLILGESGTGKEMVARAIHAHGEHAAEPFVGINCTVLPEHLLESELFGHEKGSFTGAIDRKIGKFEAADRGTIFLDEIGDLSLAFQKKLLRVLQEREFERVGGNTPVPVRGRFISATNSDLERDVEKGKFRKDLFYRFNVVTIRLPSLRKRKEDIPLLAKYFLTRYAELLKKNVRGISPDAMEVLQSYSFPGNVRELENLMERAVMLTKGDLILMDAIQDVAIDGASSGVPLRTAGMTFKQSREYAMARFEKQYLLDQLRKHRGNISASAKASGVTRQYFQRLLTRNGIDADSFRN